MRVGDYVRTKNGSFTKIKAICEQRWKEPECIYSRVLCEDNEIYEYPKYIKSSPNIINLIEVGDYVNGMEVTGIGGTRWDKNDLHCYCEHNGDENWKQVMIPAKDIKSIVTKQQFESMEYKVGV